ncbi:mechanosensitive ion channel protein MscS [Orenia metallireducens]|jgi:small conductance mechanosensitive channel|uniref:Mechanosensitive ion channel protein MscS n=1 Tax=Orenia metallireducens TaxID=1413210 RepID=A0A1C0ACW7_9FIRM|nr:mechanosensitive ion channel family protein [Orenia metallireducens]OCL28460.1 mechanosensitive ion channel protein MscS [Orenia metallireducens]
MEEFADFESVLNSFLKKILDPDLLIKIGIGLLQLAGILIAGKILLKLGNYLIDRLFEEKTKYDQYVKRRNKTLQIVLKSALRYTLYFVGGTMGLEVLGVPTTSIIAGAGVVGLAVGFGAQNLVRDVITGFFILFEKQFSVGDYVKIAGIEGIVQEIGLRITKVKNFDGDVHIVPNGKIEQVTNLSSETRRVVIDAPIDYNQNIKEAINILTELSTELKEEYPQIKEGPTVQGVQELAGSSINIRLVAMAEPMESWQIARVIRQKIKERFDEKGIEIPYNHMVIINKG